MKHILWLGGLVVVGWLGVRWYRRRRAAAAVAAGTPAAVSAPAPIPGQVTDPASPLTDVILADYGGAPSTGMDDSVVIPDSTGSAVTVASAAAASVWRGIQTRTAILPRPTMPPLATLPIVTWDVG